MKKLNVYFAFVVSGLILLFIFASMTGLMPVSMAYAGSFSTAACKACHTIDKDMVGPAWKEVAEKYGDAKTLARVFKSGFKVEDRKIAQSILKWKRQAATMTGMYNSKIKGNEDAAANAIFSAVKAGRM